MKKADLPSFIKELMSKGIVVGPVRKPGGGYTFEVLSEESELALDYVASQTPPKKFLFPPKEILLEFYDSEVKPVFPEGGFIFFGLHPCDINALLIIDKVLTSNYEDPYYKARKEGLTIIGVDCKPEETCFCESLGTFKVEEGFDIFLRESGNYYYAYIATSKGESLTGSPIFEEISEEEARRVEEESYARYKGMVKVKVEGLPQRVDELFEQEDFWKPLGDKCLGCGNCTMVCPICVCFNVVDEVNADLKSGRRVRTWDACTLPAFSLVAGGLNFRPKILQRIRNWYYDKFKIFPDEVGRLGCVGCGRCVKYCPAGIDIREEIARMWGEKP